MIMIFIMSITSCRRVSHKQSQVWLVAKLGQKLQIVSDGTRYPEIHQGGDWDSTSGSHRLF